MSDFTESGAIQQRLMEATQKLKSLSVTLGKAKQVKEWSKEARKQALAEAMAPYIAKGDTAASSEVLARSSPIYVARMKELAEVYADAESAISEWGAAQAAYDACRSLLSFSRETLRNLQG